jgi:ATP-dependent Clp protease ATP-binding subunit ClpC
MFERFTERARQVVVLAQDEARLLRHNYIGTEHILLGLLREDEGIAARVLESLDIGVQEVRAQVARIVGQGDEVTSGQIPFTPRAKKVLELALREAQSLGHKWIGTEHLLLGLVRENGGVGARILVDLGADAAKVRDEVIGLLSGTGRRKASRSGRVVRAPVPAHDVPWEYCVRTIVGPSDTWAEQLTNWRREGWELLTIVEEGDQRRALLERRVP